MWAVLKIADMDADRIGLTYPVETPDALFQQVRIQREIKQHQMMGELKVTAFTANFRTNQNLSAILVIRKPGGCPVTCNDAESLMEDRGTNTG